ncbi:MAG: hypothetical protein E6Q85_07185 [Thiothrix sp.]|nr:MAG: hypothetical protein E6Q85_07185 [Thiothrix sp.]
MMTEKQLIERDAKRNLGAELLQSVQQMKSGQKGALHQVQVSRARVPNAETVAAMQEARAMTHARFGAIDY